tara:strand:- start:249 stop:1058 length:810 start_codon:yes stop_codon:yes gene_type:complete
MKILLNKDDLNEALQNVSNLGFVPTMGSLHKGHISLIKRSLKECSKTLVSIFVNPTQFNNKLDFKKYPRDNKKDLSILKKQRADFVFMPNIKEIYGLKKTSKVKFSKKNKILCAKYRKGHFEGVLEVMRRLTNIVKPYKIFMGEKDFQQFYLIKKYFRKRNTKVISCRTIREKNKLAISSRNKLLSKKDLLKAGKIARNLISFKKNLSSKKNKKNLIDKKTKELKRLFKIKIEYLELRKKTNLKLSINTKDSKLFIAYHLKKVRLIDNF